MMTNKTLQSISQWDVKLITDTDRQVNFYTSLGPQFDFFLMTHSIKNSAADNFSHISSHLLMNKPYYVI